MYIAYIIIQKQKNDILNDAYTVEQLQGDIKSFSHSGKTFKFILIII